MSLVRKARILEIQNGFVPLKEVSGEEAEKLVEKGLATKTADGLKLSEKARRSVKVVLTGGVFDVIHPGHVFFLEKARALGDILVVVIASDETVARKKNRDPVHKEGARKRIVEGLKPVDVVVVGGKNKSEVLEAVKPDIVAFGYDQQPDEYNLPAGVEVVKIEEKLNDEKYKTTKIIESIKKKA